MKIIISGGHLTPALALIDLIQTQHPKDEVVFVGRIYSQNNFKQLAQEKNEITQRKIKFIHLKATKTTTNQSLFKKIIFLLAFTNSILSALKIIKQEKPDVFVSFGGYLAIPLAIAAKLTKTKILTHEQTHAAGFANQFIAKLANEVAISYPSSQAYFAKTKTHLTGNPIRPELMKKNPPQPTWISSSIDSPILLIIGGSQGAAAINQAIELALNKITQEWTVIHLCGKSSNRFNYKQHLEQAQAKLPKDNQNKYFVREWATALEMAWIYNHAQAAVSRAGANTVMELTIKKIPTLFIPLPNSHHNEQLKNALKLKEQQAALILPQEKLSSATILMQLAQLQKKLAEIKENLKKIKLDLTASKKIYQLIYNLSHAS